MNVYCYGFAAAIGAWVSVSISKSAGNYHDILPWPVSKTIQLKVRDQLDTLSAWSHTFDSKKLTRPTSANSSTVPTVRCSYFFQTSNIQNSLTKLIVISV